MFKRKESSRSSLSIAPLVIIALLLCLSFPFYSAGAETDMFSWFSWFKKKEAYLSPEVKGIVKENGKPVAYVQVTRQLIFIDEVERIDHAETDDKGQFYFPEKTLMSRLAANPLAEQKVSQYIFVEKNNQNYQLWAAIPPAYGEIPEYSKKLASLHCDLTNKKLKFEFKKEGFNRKYMATGICTWDEDYVPTILYDENNKRYLINNGDLNDLTEL